MKFDLYKAVLGKSRKEFKFPIDLWLADHTVIIVCVTPAFAMFVLYLGYRIVSGA